MPGSFTDWWRTWRRGLKARMPYVRKREHRVLQRKYAELIAALDGVATPAAQARLHTAKPLARGLSGEVCFFVSHAPEPELKPHVKEHLAQLLAAGISVLLVINTDLDPHRIRIDPALQSVLSGVLIRENTGFDFGAWAHVYALCRENGIDTAGWTRLFLVNDSIVGPLDAANFSRMIERVRHSSAAVVGLTESLAPLRHLQSYFLVFNAAALRSAFVQRLWLRVLNLPTKQQVIDVYETRLTALLTEHGLPCEALFPALSGDPLSSDDTSLRWAGLLRAGFPYIKARVLAQLPESQRRGLGGR